MTTSYVVNLIPVKRRPKIATKGRHAHAYTPTATLEEEAIVAAAYKGEKHQGAVKVTVHIYKALPASKPKRVERERNLTKPDIDNVLKAVLDGLNGVAYEDDTQVVEVSVTKHDRVRRAGDSIRFSVEPIDDSRLL